MSVVKSKIKVTLRKQFLSTRKHQLKNYYEISKIKNQKLLNQLKDYLLQLDFQSILFYYPLNDEVPILPVAEYLFKQKKILFPKVRNSENRQMVAIAPNDMASFSQGYKNIYEPIGKKFCDSIDVIIVPGLAFTIIEATKTQHCMYRLGYGGGFYDSFLVNHASALKIGVFYEFAKTTIDFHEQHDATLDIIITEKNIYG